MISSSDTQCDTKESKHTIKSLVSGLLYHGNQLGSKGRNQGERLHTQKMVCATLRISISKLRYCERVSDSQTGLVATGRHTKKISRCPFDNGGLGGLTMPARINKLVGTNAAIRHGKGTGFPVSGPNLDI